MSGYIHEFDEFQSHSQLQSTQNEPILKDIEDYLAGDWKLSDSATNDLFSEFDLYTDGIQLYDDLPTDISRSHSTIDLHLLCDANSHGTIAEDNAVSVQSELSKVLSSDTFKSSVEPQQQSKSELSSFSPEYEPVKCQSNQDNTATSCSHSRLLPSIGTPNLISRHEPIPVPFDQFQALINATSDTSKSTVHIISTLLEKSTIIGNNIPLKVVRSNALLTNPTSSDEIRHAEVLMNNTENGSTSGNRNNHSRTRRKPTHNVIEKRYRSSINEKINELKGIVAANDKKIQKSGILRQTVAYIKQLQSTNRRLEEENLTLKGVLKRLTLTNVDYPKQNVVRTSSIEAPTSSACNNDHSDGANGPVARKRKREMVDGSRLVLCCFMLCVLIINPFYYLLDLISSSTHTETTEMQFNVASRTLQARIDDGISTSLAFFNISWKQCVAWMLNLVICFICLVKLFVHGERIVHESEMEGYYVFKAQADQLMDQNQFNEARIYYLKCCEKLDTSIKHGYLYFVCSMLWQIIRLCLHFLYIGRWLTYWSDWMNCIDTRYYNCELNACLIQLWKIEYHYSQSSLSLFNVMLLTINTAINSGKKLSSRKRNEIYLLIALTLQKLNGLFPLMMPYMLKYLKPLDMNDIWFLNTNHLTQFIFEREIHIFKEKRLLESLRIQYLEYILYENIVHQLFFPNEQSLILNTPENELHRFSWWQHTLQVLHCITSDKQHVSDVASTTLLRQMAPSNQTIYQKMRSVRLVDERYIAIVETIHKILLVLTDDSDQNNLSRVLSLEQLGQASQLLTSMIDSSCDTNSDDSLDIAIKTLLLDSSLSLRLRLLTSFMTTSAQKMPFLNDFQRELDCYRQLNQSMKLPKQRLYLFEAIFRTSSGMNPLLTQTLFERAIQQSASMFSMKQDTSIKLDTIAALLLFCHFAPSAVYRYRYTLQQAAAIPSKANKNSDLNRLQQQCLKLIRQPYFTL